MSYILDALQRAHQEREKEPLHTPALPARAVQLATASTTRTQPAWLAFAGAAASVFACVSVLAWVLALALGWSWRDAKPWGDAGDAPKRFAVAPVTPVAPVPGNAAVIADGGPSAPKADASSAADRATAPWPEALPQPRAVPAEAAQRLAARPPRATVATQIKATTEVASAALAVTPAEPLTPELRARLPKFSFSGSSYSANPAQRMVIANGGVFREGDELAPGLVLEQIQPYSAVLRFEGRRITAPLAN